MTRSPSHKNTDSLARAEAHYHELFDRAPAISVTTRNEAGVPVIDDCNALFLSTLGYERGEVLGRPLSDFDTDAGDDLLPKGQAPETERQLLTRDGERIDVVGLARTVEGPDGQTQRAHRIYIDITARKQAEAALRETVEQARKLLTASLDSVIATDRTGHIVMFNPAAERTFGYRREEAIGRTLAELVIPPEVREEHVDGFGRFLESGESLPLGERIETTAVRVDGTPFPVELTMSRVTGHDGPLFVGYIRDISEQFAAETALRASEERFRALVQESYDIITVLARTGERRYVSPSIRNVLGYEPAELVDRSAFDLIHPDDVAAFRAAIDALLGGARQTPALELRFRHRNGDWRDFETIATNLLDEPGVNGIVFNSRDITSRKEAEAALRESEERFRTAFDHAPIGLARVSPDGRFTQVNRSLCNLVGYSETELLGMRFQEITHPEDLDDDLELAGRLFAGEIDTYQLEKRYLRKDGHPIWIELTASRVQEDGRPPYAIAQVQDITGRRNLDLERATLLASERAYTRQLRDLASMRADFSTMVAHELRSPVAALRMLTSTLGTGALAPEAEAEMIAAVHGQIDQLDRLVTDVAATAAAERDDFSVQLHPVPLNVLISGAAGAAHAALSDHPFSVGSIPDVMVWCDPERISQVLQNLLDNAAKHTPRGTPVELRARLQGSRVSIEVADGGSGLPDDDLPVIFEKFGRGRQAADRQTSGLGLGLYLSHQIVQAHGADLNVVSTPEDGTVFGFDLRVAR